MPDHDVGPLDATGLEASDGAPAAWVGAGVPGVADPDGPEPTGADGVVAGAAAGTDGVGGVGIEGAGGTGAGAGAGGGEGEGEGGGGGGFGMGGGGMGRLIDGTETVGTGGKPTWPSARAERTPATAVAASSAAAPALDRTFDPTIPLRGERTRTAQGYALR